jgi:hypothetical protein
MGFAEGMKSPEERGRYFETADPAKKAQITPNPCSVCKASMSTITKAIEECHGTGP